MSQSKNKSVLLTRDQFRCAVFHRDGNKCVFCDNQAVDAHHILERRLWNDGGYYLDNGASVCREHHLACEQTLISVEDVRVACGITKPILPEHLYDDQIYDKWGNIIQPNGTRLAGELFFDESVQKILEKGGVLNEFVHFIKYPRTHHLPWSLGMTEDDRSLRDLSGFEGRRVIVTEKMDGENSTLYNDYTHARSVDSRNHPSRNWLKQFWSTFSSDIPEHWRVCVENLYATHSLKYSKLPSYVMGFSIWNEKNICLSWDDTIEWFKLLGITPVPVLWDGIFDEKAIRNLWQPGDEEKHEGYVIRVADSFSYSDFKTKVGKFVRENHVQTVKHWMHGRREIEKNILDDHIDEDTWSFRRNGI